MSIPSLSISEKCFCNFVPHVFLHLAQCRRRHAPRERTDIQHPALMGFWNHSDFGNCVPVSCAVSFQCLLPPTSPRLMRFQSHVSRVKDAISIGRTQCSSLDMLRPYVYQSAERNACTRVCGWAKASSLEQIAECAKVQIMFAHARKLLVPQKFECMYDVDRST